MCEDGGGRRRTSLKRSLTVSALQRKCLAAPMYEDRQLLRTRRQRRSWGDKGRMGGLPPTSVYYCSSGIKKLSNWFGYS